MTPEDILRCTAMPLSAPSFGTPPFRVTGRSALTVAYESDPAVIREALPEPLTPNGATVLVSFVDAAESPFGVYRTCAISIAALLENQPVNYCHAVFVDQEGPIYAGREIWGLPATRGEPELILGENRVAGVLDLGYGTHLRVSIPVAEDAGSTDDVSMPPQISCKLIPGADGTPIVAQLVALQPTEITVKQCWSGAAELEADAGSPLDLLPVKKISSGQYVVADMTLPHGRVVHDYLAAAR